MYSKHDARETNLIIKINPVEIPVQVPFISTGISFSIEVKMVLSQNPSGKIVLKLIRAIFAM